MHSFVVQDYSTSAIDTLAFFLGVYQLYLVKSLVLACMTRYSEVIYLQHTPE